MLEFCINVSLLGLLTMLGGLVFSAVETPVAQALDASYAGFVGSLQTFLTNPTFNATEGADLYDQLLGLARGAPRRGRLGPFFVGTRITL